MPLFRRKKEARDFGTAGLTIPPNSASFGAGSVGAVGVDRALTLSTVWACVRLRADIVSTLPVHIYQERPGRRERLPVPPQFLNPGGTKCDHHEWLYSGQVSLDLRGNSYGVISQRDRLLYPTQVELLDPDRVLVHYDKDGNLVSRIDGKVFPYEDLWHEKANTWPGSPVGLSPIAYAARTMGIVLHAERFGSDWFSDGAHPTSVLTTTQKVDEAAAKTIKARVLAATRGNREPLVLGAGLELKAMQIAPEESQFLETLKFGTQQICRFFNVDPELVGGESGGSSMTYANRDQRLMDFLAYRLAPTIVRRESAWSRWLPADQMVRLSTDSFMRTDAKTAAEVHEIRIRSKQETSAEARHERDLPPLTPEQVAEIKNLAGGADNPGKVLAEIVQKVYLGVGKVLTAEEARQIVNLSGGQLGPDFTPDPPAAPGLPFPAPVEDDQT